MASEDEESEHETSEDEDKPAKKSTVKSPVSGSMCCCKHFNPAVL